MKKLIFLVGSLLAISSLIYDDTTTAATKEEAEVKAKIIKRVKISLFFF